MPRSRDWLSNWTFNETTTVIKELALAHAREGGEQGKRIANCITSGDFLSLCNYSLDYETSSTHELRHCRQALGFYQKLDFIDIGIDKKEAALKTFWEAERLCSETNKFFALYEDGRLSIDPRVSAVLHSAARKISRVLGEVPTFSELKYRFGPGATTLSKKRVASIAEKLQAGISCSEDLLPYASRILEELPHLSSLHSSCSYTQSDGIEVDSVLVTVTNDVVSFVPKNAKTFRSIGVGGTLNLMVQLAFGDYMTERLAAFGVDLRDQSLNQEWACVGSLDDSVATIDLSSASDTIATALVYHLLPLDWAIALDSCRSAKAIIDGKTIELEKFSSMGNGYTFPLESLIFWAISSSACTDNYASVYGDDIIVNSVDAPFVCECLRICGFVVNLSKSYLKGSFRESCGADYHKGTDIRPYYQKKLLNVAELFKLHNFYARNELPDYQKIVLTHIPEVFRNVRGPDGFGDGHLIGDWKPILHKRMKTHGYGGVFFHTFKQNPVLDDRARRKGDCILPLYLTYAASSGEDVLPKPKTWNGLTSYLRLGRRGKCLSHPRGRFTYASEPLPERVSPVDGAFIKMPTYPGTQGYRKIKVYTFDRN